MKVVEITRLILMPMSWLVSKSLATARMAMPILVWLMRLYQAEHKADHQNGVTTVTSVVEAPPMVTILDRAGMVG